MNDDPHPDSSTPQLRAEDCGEPLNMAGLTQITTSGRPHRARTNRIPKEISNHILRSPVGREGT